MAFCTLAWTLPRPPVRPHSSYIHSSRVSVAVRLPLFIIKFLWILICVHSTKNSVDFIFTKKSCVKYVLLNFIQEFPYQLIGHIQQKILQRNSFQFWSGFIFFLGFFSITYWDHFTNNYHIIFLTRKSFVKFVLLIL